MQPFVDLTKQLRMVSEIASEAYTIGATSLVAVETAPTRLFTLRRGGVGSGHGARFWNGRAGGRRGGIRKAVGPVEIDDDVDLLAGQFLDGRTFVRKNIGVLRKTVVQ